MPVESSALGLSRYACALLLVSGCASSIRSELSSVRTLSKTHASLPSLREGHVDEASEEDVKGLLAKPLASDAAVRIALLNNRELRARLRELGVAQGRVLQAGLIANPLFEVELLPERDSDVELRVEYELTSLLMAPMKRRAEQHDLEAARLDVAGEVVQLGYDVRIAFYALQTAEQRTGMGGMGEMEMPIPPNSLPMRGAPGPFGYIDMGGMFTVLKVREDPSTADLHGWYDHPKGTVADRADPARLAADGIDVKGA